MTILSLTQATKFANEAANAAFTRALNEGYCRTMAVQFARDARRDAAWWERPEHTAVRVVPSKQARNRDSRSIA